MDRFPKFCLLTPQHEVFKLRTAEIRGRKDELDYQCTSVSAKDCSPHWVFGFAFMRTYLVQMIKVMPIDTPMCSERFGYFSDLGDYAFAFL